MAVRAASTALAAARAWAADRNDENQKAGHAYLAGEGPFQQRLAQNTLAAAFLTDFYALVARWAEWATAQVEQWPEDPSQAQPDLAQLDAIMRRAQWSS